jgi:transaldolase
VSDSTAQQGATLGAQDNIRALAAQGVSVWLDDLSRARLASGGLASLVGRGVVGVTTNPTIFEGALRGSADYADQVRDLAARGVDVEEAARMITTYDVRWACDVLRAVYDRTGGVDGRVSIEVDPRKARDTAGTIAEARGLWWLVDRPNLFVKIPATVEGLPAITACLADGISVNVTLIFSLDRYRQVMDAHLAGLERAAARGIDLASIASVASFFVSRVDTEVDQRLEKIGSPEALALRGDAGVANARLAYQAYEQVIASDRWRALAARGARVQRPLWASTGVKNPAYRDTMYVEDLVAPDTVNTMPEKTFEAVVDHGRIVGDTVRPYYASAQQTFASLAGVGIDMHDVVQVLEVEAVDKFDTSSASLIASLKDALNEATTSMTGTG